MAPKPETTPIRIPRRIQRHIDLIRVGEKDWRNCLIISTTDYFKVTFHEIIRPFNFLDLFLIEEEGDSYVLSLHDLH